MRTRSQEEEFPLRGAACLVEPNEAERKRMAQIMRRVGLAVHETGSGAAAGFLAAQTRLQAMVMNLMLRDSKSLLLIGQLRRAYPDMRIVAVMPAGMDPASHRWSWRAWRARTPPCRRPSPPACWRVR